MLVASHISFSRANAVVLDDVSVSVVARSRLGVVGPNGIGKTTLLRLLAGIEVPESGTIRRTPPSLSVGYLPQEPDTASGETLRAYLARRTGVAEAEGELDRLTVAMADDVSLVDDYTVALDRFLALGGGDFETRLGVVCADVGLPADRLDVEMGALSGGQAARAALAAILLARFDVFLLDEPTNNLDFGGLERLERFLDGLPGAVVVVSHDRDFLDRSVTRILEVTEETHRAVEYAGGYSEYVEARGLARRQQSEAHGKYVAERERLTDRAREQRSWAVQGGRAAVRKKADDHDRAQQGFKVNRTEKQASKVRATEQRLARLDVVDKPWEGWQLDLSITPVSRSGDVVARLAGAVVERGSFRLGPVDVELGWQERLALVGPNGSGKTTLLAALLGRLPLAAGSQYLGPSVVVGEVDQARRTFEGGGSLLDAFVARTGMVPVDARTLLAKFGLGARHVLRRSDRLSPGERTRASLALLMAEGVNLLVLDEPTNHLDLPAIEQLEQALGTYQGTLILVTHDRRFLDAVQVTRTLDLGDLGGPGELQVGGPDHLDEAADASL